MLSETWSFREKGWKLPCFSRQPLENAPKGCWSRWALLKGYWKAAGKCPKTIGSCWAILKGYRKAAGKCPNTRYRPLGEEAELLSGYWQKRGNFHPFSLKHHISV
jgi:hypothetical protein